MRVSCIEELDIFAPANDSQLRWHLLNTTKDDKPVVRLYNFKQQPTTLCRFIHFAEYDSPYHGEIYGDCFHYPLDVM